jgi:UDPglucose--hexose-1-phosphate uridylyltransferase
VSEVRRNPITGDPLVFAPERAARPGAMSTSEPRYLGTSGDRRGTEDPRYLGTDRCPFCPGHESDTPPEIAQLGDPWRARVFPNKYPPLDGAEVIVESPQHDAAFDAIDNPLEIVQLYADRVRAHGDAAYVHLFKNEGRLAGSSIPHLHSQLIPTPFLPLRIARELAAFDVASRCPLCDAREFLVIHENDTFRALAPLAASFAYQQWLVPRRHVSDLTALRGDELRDLAGLLKLASGKVRAIASSYNWAFLNFPRASGAHFYIDLFPRMTMLAGFELGTGTFVEIIDPAIAVERLRA